MRREDIVKILQEQFGLLNGKSIISTTLVNNKGMEITSLNYGCIITKVLVPDKDGQIENVVLGFDSIEEYEKYSPYFGAVVGRFAGRIKGASFDLDKNTYRLAKNNMGNHLHGGLKGFNKVLWLSEVIEGSGESSVIYTYMSPDGEEGYPGNLKVKIKYTLTDENEFYITYEAVSDKKTIVNLTNHSYFNLSGNLKNDILDHELTLKSDTYLELDSELIPTGEILSVQDSEFDFREGRRIKDGVESSHPQCILAGKGYDHPFLLTDHNNEEIILLDHVSGRSMTIETDQPGVVLYTGNQLSSDFTIRGVQSRKYLGLCLETQGLPDNINIPHFPSSILNKDEVLSSTTKFKFSIHK